MVIQEDKFSLIYKKILNKSIFTDKQIEILLDYLTKKEKDKKISNNEYVQTILGNKYRKGTYFRIFKQALKNMNKVIFSVILLSYMEIISHNDITNLTAIVIENKYDDLEKIIEYIERRIYESVKRK